MFIIILAAFIFVSFALSQRYDRDMITVVPVTTVILVFILYILAFFRALGAIDIIAAGVLVLLIFFFFRNDKNERKKIISDFVKKITRPEIILLAVMSLLIIFLEKNRIFTWWDDINFWSTDTKSLYFLGGFAGKYGNVSPSFGDYPQGLELFKWLFLHMSPHKYIAGLQFAGYYVLNLIFLIPVAHKTAPRLRPFLIIAAILVPGVADGIHFGGTCADVTMGIVYGSLLVSLYEIASGNEKDDNFSLIKITSYAVFLSSIKQVGVQWALLSLIFWMIVCRKKSSVCFGNAAGNGRNVNSKGNGGKMKSQFCRLLIPILAVILYLASWLSFCLVRRRVAKLTSEGLHMAKSGFTVPKNTSELMQSFAKAFFDFPMHVDKNLTVDLPPAAMTVILIVAPLVIYVASLIAAKRRGNISVAVRLTMPETASGAVRQTMPETASGAVRQTMSETASGAVRLTIFEVISAAASYGIIFLAHITIFRTESQYLNPANMALSISRYGAPFTIGGLLLAAGIIAAKNTNIYDNSEAGAETIDISKQDTCIREVKIWQIIAAVFTAFAILCTDYSGLWKAVYGYRQTLDADKEYISEMHDDDGLLFEEAADRCKGSDKLWGHRVIYFRDSKNIHWVKDTYISADVSPVPVIFADISENEEDGTLAAKVMQSHAEYLYSDDAGDTACAALSAHTEDGEFKYGHFYRIICEAGSYRLERAEFDTE